MRDRDRRVDELFDRALELDGPARGDFLASCGGLRGDVEDLLRAHAAMNRDFLELPAGERLESREAAPGDRIGRYVVERVVASGGSSTVYEATQERPRRRVALKVMHAGFAAEADLRRFLEEAEILGRLQHPDIAHVYEAGVDDDQPYIAMEYVAPARTLLGHAETLDVRDRLRLFVRICDAVHHGHQKGVIHRDIKPPNLLVRDDGRPKVIDFGIARAEGEAGLEVAGTIPYMSPEQCEPGAHLDVRSDVYSLGVVLYELLSRRPPYESTTSVTDAIATIRTADPRPMQRRFRGDLEAVVRTCLRKDPDERYASAAALADDLRRYLAHEPVRARPASLARQLRLFARRRAGIVASVAAFLMALVAGTAVSVKFALRAEGQRREAVRARDVARRKTYLATIGAAASALRAFDIGEARLHLEAAPRELRGWEWRHLRSRLDGSTRTIPWPGEKIYTGRTSDSGRIAATSHWAARVWEAKSGEVVCTVPRQTAPHTLQSACALDSEGRLLAVGEKQGILELRDAATGELLHAARCAGFVWKLAFSPDGALLAAGVVGSPVRLFRTEGLVPAGTLDHESVYSLAFTPDGRGLYTGGSRDRTIRLHDVGSGRRRLALRGHEDNVECLDLSPDGALLASASLDGTVRLWDTSTGEERAVLRGHVTAVKAVAFSPAGDMLASGGADRVVRVWGVRGRREIAVLQGHATMIRALGYLRDGTLVSFGRADEVKLWSVEAQSRDVLYGIDRWVEDLRFVAGGTRVAAAGRDGTLAVWDRASGRLVGKSRAVPGKAAILPGGERCWFVGEDGRVTLRTFPGGDVLEAVGSTGAATTRAVAALPDGGVVAGRHGEVRIFGRRRTTIEFASTPLAFAVHPRKPVLAAASKFLSGLWTLDGERIGELPREAVSLAFRADGGRLALGTTEGDVVLVDPGARRVLRRFAAHAGFVDAVAFSPDGTRLASAGRDGTVRIWEPSTGTQLLVLRGHPLFAGRLAWSPDGAVLASGGGGRGAEACAVRLWRTGGPAR